MSDRQPIDTAPRDGTEFLATDGARWFITAYLPAQCSGSGFGVIHSCCGYYEDAKPTYWMPLPVTPSSDDEAAA